ncbi:MAG: 23S rRNA (adenine(2503)-C(2))-methyltransferase [candidate division Zixibacteria bacterium RBG_16_53_22]|nr:MAG: 23S rRNA (adenine(2503)-C(2))-methyltransferase [candidate division Zixibacteria bacterium RBG_16_53_22]
MERVDLKGMGRTEVEAFVQSLGLDRFRGKQIFRWIYQEWARDFSPMSDISKGLRQKLSEAAMISELERVQMLESVDGSTKFLFRLADGPHIESVLIPEADRVTLCVSSQAGCPAKCAFCATGNLGYKRNLKAGEIVDQFIHAQRVSRRRISNVVFMGMGEPMLNLDNVLKACRILNDDYGPALSQKKITISTVGIVRGMKKFVVAANKLGLALSLHSADESTRQGIMPVAKKNPLSEIMAQAKRYTELTRRRISFEYLLLGGINDSITDAKKLVKIIHGIPCKINLMRYNPVDGLPFERPREKDVLRFQGYLNPRVYAVTVRESRGVDIKGACGQLAGQMIDQQNHTIKT